MKKLDKYILHTFEKEFFNGKPVYQLLETQTIWKFRFICYKFNFFLKHISIPDIKKNSFYEVVFIMFNKLPNIEFIIRNTIIKLGCNWSYTIVCGLNNYDYIVKIANNINTNIKIIQLEYKNINQNEYSNLLKTEIFWNKLNGEKILLFHEDTLIIYNGISPFLKYDYIGTHFIKNNNISLNYKNNYNLSIRTKTKMLEVIKNYHINHNNGNKVFDTRYQYLPEELFFSKIIQERNIGNIASWDIEIHFSTENIFNPQSIEGEGHNFRNSNIKWENCLNYIFTYKPYHPKSNLNDFLEFKNMSIKLNKNQIIPNAFDIDIYFYCKANKIQYINNLNNLILLEHINNNALDGLIYHPKQLLNLFGEDIELYTFLDNIYVFYNKNVYIIHDFVEEFIYKSNFNNLSDLLINKIYNNLNINYDTILLVFLGNKIVAENLLLKLVKYKKINRDFNIAFCINKNAFSNIENIKLFIKHNFEYYAIYYSNEMGNDIIPTMLMYNDIIKNYTIKHIIKLHTKTQLDIYHNLTNCLLTNSIDKILQNKENNCNCIGPTNSYISLQIDYFNNKLKRKYSHYIQANFLFVAGTIFYTKNEVFDAVLKFIKNNNYRAYLLNNLYENNAINDDYSPIHFIERLFGSIII